MTKTYNQMRERLNWYVGRKIDFDGYYGMQCMDLAVDFVYWATGIRMWGDAKDAPNNAFNGKATVYRNTPDFQQEVGDVAVFTRGRFDNQYGHIGIVYDKGNLNGCTILEQNWDGMANTGAALRWDDCNGIGYFIRIKFDGANVKQTAAVTVKKTKVNSAPLLKVGSVPPKNLKWSTGAYYMATIDSLGATPARRTGPAGKYKFHLNNYSYGAGTQVYVFESINGWCRIYWNNHNEWIWHERLRVREIYK